MNKLIEIEILKMKQMLMNLMLPLKKCYKMKAENYKEEMNN